MIIIVHFIASTVEQTKGFPSLVDRLDTLVDLHRIENTRSAVDRHILFLLLVETAILGQMWLIYCYVSMIDSLHWSMDGHTPWSIDCCLTQGLIIAHAVHRSTGACLWNHHDRRHTTVDGKTYTWSIDTYTGRSTCTPVDLHMHRSIDIHILRSTHVLVDRHNYLHQSTHTLAGRSTHALNDRHLHSIDICTGRSTHALLIETCTIRLTPRLFITRSSECERY